MFRETTWWWEITTAGRKVFIAGIAVFGTELGQMQVHLTSLMLVLVLLLTVWVQPFGGEERVLLQVMEALTLVCIWMTLWAGSIFNTYPKCVDPESGVGGAPMADRSPCRRGAGCGRLPFTAACCEQVDGSPAAEPMLRRNRSRSSSRLV